MTISTQRFTVKEVIKFNMLFGYKVFDSQENKNLPFEFNENQKHLAESKAELKNALSEIKNIDEQITQDLIKNCLSIDSSLAKFALNKTTLLKANKFNKSRRVIGSFDDTLTFFLSQKRVKVTNCRIDPNEKNKTVWIDNLNMCTIIHPDNE